jgi:osmotically-inducible protein OsmY
VRSDNKEEYNMSDRSLERAVMEALAEDPKIHGNAIVAEADSGHVVLRGTVGSLPQRTEAVRCVRRLPGVRSVDDRIRARLMGPEAEADADLEAAVLDALIADPSVHSSDVDVEVRDGAVTLRGMVELAGQRDRAARAAHEVPGVTSVTNHLAIWLTVWADDVAERITDAIGADAQVGIDEVMVTVDDNDVTLTGWVSTPDHRAAAIAAAANAPGVAQVHDRMILRPRGAVR